MDGRGPTGRLKTREGRLLLAHLEGKGLVTLPPAGAQPSMVPDIAFYHPRLRDYLLELVTVLTR